jgi:hypothetical protein
VVGGDACGSFFREPQPALLGCARQTAKLLRPSRLPPPDATPRGPLARALHGVCANSLEGERALVRKYLAPSLSLAGGQCVRESQRPDVVVLTVRAVSHLAVSLLRLSSRHFDLSALHLVTATAPPGHGSLASSLASSLAGSPPVSPSRRLAALGVASSCRRPTSSCRCMPIVQPGHAGCTRSRNDARASAVETGGSDLPAWVRRHVSRETTPRSAGRFGNYGHASA